MTGDAAVQKSNMLIMQQARARKPANVRSQRTNDFVRTHDGWRTCKTTGDGGFRIEFGELQGALNKLPPAEVRGLSRRWSVGAGRRPYAPRQRHDRQCRHSRTGHDAAALG
jgi:hypothetical protein